MGKGKKMGHARESVAKATKKMGKGQSGVMKMPGGKGKPFACLRKSKMD